MYARCYHIMYARWDMIMYAPCIEQFVGVVDSIEFGLVVLLLTQLSRDEYALFLQVKDVHL